MSASSHFPVAAVWLQICTLLDVSPGRVLARIGRSADFFENEGKGVDAQTYFALWEAFEAEYGDADLPLRLGQGAARGPFQPALLAFSSSPDVQTGLQRLALFKPLVAPIRLEITEQESRLDVVFHPEGPAPVPDIMAATEIIFFLEFVRTFTAHRIVPLAVELPELSRVSEAYEAFVGVPIRAGGRTMLSFSAHDAQRKLISADTEFYALIERELLSRLSCLEQEGGIVQRVQRCVTELLPSGQISTDRVAERLGLSKRSLQRKLKETGTSFQAILEQTRASLALTYLREKQLSAEETSYLLAYRDPNSFYRAFHGWTGMTPAQAREMSEADPVS
ncbi:AraC-type DNA-binding protein [Poseidonocella pacifica]|uniref:AraC-type DNA-binding protein n=1 Tax=Poseidonocella pacifica TaxID=871651 RepID=A0A1I0V1U6_9RHOB|nr:AraC family transcriptional regulator [Poseidonocella pacifica]SFA70319.1 AraC-type DNA-binding protein [Poseidonocella pacifica]